MRASVLVVVVVVVAVFVIVAVFVVVVVVVVVVVAAVEAKGCAAQRSLAYEVLRMVTTPEKKRPLEALLSFYSTVSQLCIRGIPGIYVFMGAPPLRPQKRVFCVFPRIFWLCTRRCIGGSVKGEIIVDMIERQKNEFWLPF